MSTNMDQFKMGDCLWELLVSGADNRQEYYDRDDERVSCMRREQDFNPLDWDAENHYINDPYYD